MNRNLLFAACALACLGANALMGCAQPLVRYPSCGEFQTRASDGAACRECVDASGAAYAQCHNAVMIPPPDTR